MSEKVNHTGKVCDNKTASTLAASSVVRFFKERNWKIISFFPNTPCCEKKNKNEKE